MLIVPQNVTAPATITVVLKSPTFGTDLSAVTGVSLAVLRRDGSSATWACSIVSSTPGELIAQYAFTGSGEITTSGVYQLVPTLVAPSGTILGAAVNMFVSPDPLVTPRVEESTWIAVTGRINGPAMLPSSGPTASRPVNPPIGFEFFDTDVGGPVWWTGTAWKSAGGGGAGNVFVYQAGSVAAGNLYNTFGAAYTAANALQNAGIPSKIYVRPPVSGTSEVTAGSYNIALIELAGVGSQPVDLTWRDGAAIISKTAAGFENLAMHSQSTTQTWKLTYSDFASGTAYVTFGRNVSVGASGAGCFLRVYNDDTSFNFPVFTANIDLEENCHIADEGGQAILGDDDAVTNPFGGAPVTLSFTAQAGVVVDARSIGEAQFGCIQSIGAILWSSSAVVATIQASLAQITVVGKENASFVNYTPGSGGGVAGALDQLFAGQPVTFPTLVWRAGVSPNGNVVTTWAAIQGAIALLTPSGNACSGLIAMCDSGNGPLTIPTSDTQCANVELRPFDKALGADTITLTDGVILRNPTLRGTLTVSYAATSQPPIIVESGCSCRVVEGATLSDFGTGATVPPILMRNGSYLIFEDSGGSFSFTNATVRVDPGANVNITISGNTGWWNTGPAFDMSKIVDGGGSGAVVNFFIDRTVDPNVLKNQPGFSGTINVNLNDYAKKGQASIVGGTGKTAPIAVDFPGGAIFSVFLRGGGWANTHHYELSDLGSNSFTISAIKADNTLNTADTSTLNWLVP